jgi:hypothetical protein
MPEKKQAPPETLMIRLARVAGVVAGTVAAKTAKVVARTGSPAGKGSQESREPQSIRPKQGRSKGKKKTKRTGPKRSRTKKA